VGDEVIPVGSRVSGVYAQLTVRANGSTWVQDHNITGKVVMSNEHCSIVEFDSLVGRDAGAQIRNETLTVIS
jgi:hypothetical protein